MRSLILQTATRYLIPLLLLFSLFLLFRGHNKPGGGFVGGLVAAAAFALFTIAFDVQTARQTLRAQPRQLIAFGLSLAVSSAALSLLVGNPFMTSLWGTGELPAIGVPSTPLMFDTGVYFVVIGVTVLIIFSLSEVGDEG